MEDSADQRRESHDSLTPVGSSGEASGFNTIVLKSREGLQMFWVHARTLAADVMYFMAVGYRTVAPLIVYAMGIYRHTLSTDRSIPAHLRSLLPYPAGCLIASVFDTVGRTGLE